MLSRDGTSFDEQNQVLGPEAIDLETRPYRIVGSHANDGSPGSDLCHRCVTTKRLMGRIQVGILHPWSEHDPWIQQVIWVHDSHDLLMSRLFPNNLDFLCCPPLKKTSYDIPFSSASRRQGWTPTGRLARVSSVAGDRVSGGVERVAGQADSELEARSSRSRATCRCMGCVLLFFFCLCVFVSFQFCLEAARARNLCKYFESGFYPSCPKHSKRARRVVSVSWFGKQEVKKLSEIHILLLLGTRKRVINIAGQNMA